MVNDFAEGRIESPLLTDSRQPVFDGIQPADNKLFANNDSASSGAASEHLPAFHFDHTGSISFAPERHGRHSVCDSPATNGSGTGADTSTIAQASTSAQASTGAQSSDSISGPASGTASSNPFANLASLDQQLTQDIQSGASPQQFDQDALALVQGLVSDLQAVVSEIGTSVPPDSSGTAPTDSNNTGTGSGPSTDAGVATNPVDGTPTPAGGANSGAVDSTAGSTTSTPPADSNGASNQGSSATDASDASDSVGSAVGPNGQAVGSTAGAFGPSAMPQGVESAPGFYVSATDGSATGDGTSADPFATLQQAQQAMENSNIKTTYVEGGTYNLSSSLNLTAADSGETFIADNSNGAVTLDGGGTASNLIAINGANNVSVEGFTMQNTAPTPQLWTQADWFAENTGGDAIMATNSSGDNFSYNAVNNVGIAFNLVGVSNSTVDGNDINNVQQAINTLPSGSWDDPTNNTNDTFDSNRIQNVSNATGVDGNYMGAIDLARATNATVTNNVIENTQSAGVEIQDSGFNGETVQENNIKVSGNTIENTNTAALASEDWNTTSDVESLHPFDMGAIYVTHGVNQAPGDLNLTIANNYVTNAGAGISNYGIYLDDTVSGADVEGNIVRGGGSGSDMVIHGGSDDTVKNNVFDLTSPTGNEKGLFLQSTDPQMQNNVISDNIFYANGANGGAVPTEIHPGDEPAISGNDYWGTSASGLSYESNPTTTNPQFTDPSSGNYSQSG